MKIKVIVFDLGNVLLPFDYSYLITALNRIDTGLGERFYKRYKENYFVHRQFEKSEISENEFWKFMQQWLENKIEREYFYKIYSDLFDENEKLIKLLPKLKEKYKLILLSNTNKIHMKYGWQKYGFLKYFDKLILSHEVKSVKPEQKIFKAAEEYSNEKSEAHLFIDDIEEYCNSAKALGWEAIQCLNSEYVLNELIKRKII